MDNFKDLFKDIMNLNERVWGNKKGDYNPKLEASMQIEEALEGFSNLDKILEKLNIDKGSRNHQREISRKIVDFISDEEKIDFVEAIDKHIDSIYISIGSLHKLGLEVKDIYELLLIVHKANMYKTKKDKMGKVIKDKNFVEPQEAIRKYIESKKHLKKYKDK